MINNVGWYNIVCTHSSIPEDFSKEISSTVWPSEFTMISALDAVRVTLARSFHQAGELPE